MKITNTTVASAAEFVSDYLSRHLAKEFYYHDFFHTFCVVNAVDMLCTATGIAVDEKRMVLIAAWFHDTGYTIQTDGHEAAGALIAEEFLRTSDIDQEEINKVKQYIMATQYPPDPNNELEQILCDADLMHIGSPDFMERSNLLRKEWQATKNKVFTDTEWYQLNIEFIKKHRFHTDYCKEQFEKRRKKNLNKLTEKLKEPGPVAVETNIKLTAEDKKAKSEKLPGLERGVETLFKLTSGNHMKLSAMADNKAHILLSINSIIISVVLSLLVKNLAEMPYMIFPTVLLLGVCVATIVFAVLTTKPKISKGVFTAEQIHNRQANLLFFGNFHKMGWESYEWGIQEIMYDREYLYRSITKDIYFLGKVLAAKYRYLNIGYKVFMFGLIASMIAFAMGFMQIY